MFFRWPIPRDLNPIRDLQAQEFLDKLTAVFDVRLVEQDCAYAEVLDREQPDLCLFEVKNTYTGHLKISGVRENRSVPKVLFLHSDPNCYSRPLALEAMEQLDLDACFAVDAVYAYFLPELADRLYTMPHSINPEHFRDFGLPKTNVVAFFGHFYPQRPWRVEAARELRKAFPCTMFPHDTWRTDATTTRMRYGEVYARTLNASQFVPVEGAYYQLFTRKFFETPACRSALVVPRIGALGSLGFEDMKNCIMGEPVELAEKIDHFFSDETAYNALVDAGCALIAERHTHAHRTQIRDWFEMFRAKPAGTRIVQDAPLGPFHTEPAGRPAVLPALGRRPQIDFVLLWRGIRALEQRKLRVAEREFIACIDLLFARHFSEPRFYLALVRLLQGRALEAIYLLTSVYIEKLQERGDPLLDPRAAAFLVLSYLCLKKEDKAAEVMQMHAHLVRDELFWVRDLMENPLPAPAADAPQNLSLFSYMPMDADAWRTFVREVAKAHDIELADRQAPGAVSTQAATPANWRMEKDAPVSGDGPRLAVTLGSIALGYRSKNIRIYRDGPSIYYEIPDGVEMELLSGSDPLDAATSPVGKSRLADLARIRLHGKVRGSVPVLTLYAYDESGACRSRAEKLDKPTTTLWPAVKRPQACRIGLTLTGTGTLVVDRVGIRFFDKKPGTPSTPLGELLNDEYIAARKAGAEVPRPEMPSIL